MRVDYVSWYKDRIGTEINAGINKGGDNRFGRFKVFIKMVPVQIIQVLIKDKINVVYPEGALILEIEHKDQDNEKITSKKENCLVPYSYMADTYNKGHTWIQEDEIEPDLMRNLRDTQLVYVLPAGNLTYEIQTEYKNPGSTVWQY